MSQFHACHSIQRMCRVKKCYRHHFIRMNQAHSFSIETVIFYNSRSLCGKLLQQLLWERSKHSNWFSLVFEELIHFSFNFSLKYGPYDLPATVIDSLEEFPICDCGKLCPPLNIHFRTCQISIRANSLIKTNQNLIYGDSVYCSDYCRSLYQKCYVVEWKINWCWFSIFWFFFLN